MIVAITGGTAGIGQAIGNEYEARLADVRRLSRRTGHNIANIHQIIIQINDADIFINNAQYLYYQTMLLEKVFHMWRGYPLKKIVNISSMMVHNEYLNLPERTYVSQKCALEDLHYKLRGLDLNDYPKLVLVRPGKVATQPNDVVGPGCADVNVWAKKCVELIEMDGLEIPEFSLRGI